MDPMPSNTWWQTENIEKLFQLESAFVNIRVSAAIVFAKQTGQFVHQQFEFVVHLARGKPKQFQFVFVVGFLAKCVHISILPGRSHRIARMAGRIRREARRKEIVYQIQDTITV